MSQDLYRQRIRLGQPFKVTERILIIFFVQVSSSSVGTEILQKVASRPRSSRVHLDAGQSSPTTNTIPKSESVIKSDVGLMI